MSHLWVPLLAVVAGLVGAAIGDLASEEIRARLDRIPQAILRLALRRLPRQLRAEQSEDWLAELHEILRGAEALPVTRIVVGTRFAVGLLLASSCIGRELAGAADAAAPPAGQVVIVKKTIVPAGAGDPAVTLPAGMPRFVGRAVSVAYLLDPRLGSVPGTTTVISGAAGIGKTSLALHAAHGLVDRFPDGQLFASLGAHDQGPGDRFGDVLRSFLGALSEEDVWVPSSLDGQVDVFQDLLARKRVLIVLDDVASLGQVRHLLPPAGSRSLVLVTSRAAAAGIPEGALLNHLALQGFSKDEAVELLRVCGGPTQGTAEEYGRLADLCAGFPLALRIAAARVRMSGSWSEVVEELSEAPSSLLASGEVAAGALRVAFDESYRILSPELARVFRLIGAQAQEFFSPGQVAMWAGISVAKADAALRTLVEDSLIQEPRRRVFTMHRLLRDYARERHLIEDEEAP